MDLSDLKPPKGAKHAKKRVGRGYGSGTGVTSGRGHKGQKSRSGFHRKRGFEGGQMPLHRRLPKRGFFNPFRVEYAVVNLDTLAERFEAGTEITPDLLRECGIVRSKTKLVKVLGRGDVDRVLTVKAHKFSGTAAEKIAAAGGSTEVISRGAATGTDAEPASDDTGAAPAEDATLVATPEGAGAADAPASDADAEQADDDGDQGNDPAASDG